MTPDPLRPLDHPAHTSLQPCAGAIAQPRSWLVENSDAGRISLNGSWRFRLSPAVPGTMAARGLPRAPRETPPDDDGSTRPPPDPAATPADSAAPDDDGDGDDGGDGPAPWTTIQVPSHWVLDPRFGGPIYTNVQYPFPVDPPHVPDENPTGDYHRRIEVPAGWLQDGEVRLRFDGVESFFQVWVNGTWAGAAFGSRLAHEFEVAGLLRPGGNTVTVRVVQWSAGSYLEDQDQWWLPGIFRDVALLHRPGNGIDDLWIQADYDPETGTGTLIPEITASSAAFPVTLRCAELGVEVTWDSPDQVGEVRIGGDQPPARPGHEHGPQVRPWSPESPRLYAVTVESAGESITLRTGFRRVEIRGDRFLVNGRPVVFSGMNRHETHPDRGRVFDEGQARADLALMKRHNVNALRTSHYPPHPKLLDLADELGLWVMLECDLETHGFEAHGWAGNPSDDPRWRQSYLDRMRRTLERDKNHPSVVIWSLGNESGTGENLAAMAEWVRRRDPGRPVHYEGDHTGAYTDLYSRMYASVPEVASIGRDDDLTALLGCSTADSARVRSIPFVLCEYAHAMGNGPGGLDAYRELVDRHDRLHGGFVWEWRDHGLRTRTADGTEFFGYGGDFGEVVHDGNFVMDGMVLSDGTPSPGLAEFAAVEQPIVLTRDAPCTPGPRSVTGPEGVGGAGTLADAGRIIVRNRRFCTDTSDLLLRWALEREGSTVLSGERALLGDGGRPVEAGCQAPLTLTELAEAGHGPNPASAPAHTPGETFLTLEVVLREDTAWAPAGHAVARAQWEVPSAPARPPVREPVTLTEGIARFAGPRLIRLGGAEVSGPEAELWRAPTDNDEGASSPDYLHTDPYDFTSRRSPSASHAQGWREAGLDRLVRRLVSWEHSAEALTVRRRVSAAQSRAALDVTERWRAVRTLAPGREPVIETLCEITMVPSSAAPGAGWDGVWPRLGVHLELPADVQGASWFGLGPHDSYPDTVRSVRVGRFDADIEDLCVDYARPQESGYRPGLRELVLHRAGRGWLQVTAEPDAAGRRPGFTLSRHSSHQLARAGHPHELPAPEATHLYIDAAQHGLGSRACGPDVWPTAMLRPQARTLSLRFRAL